MTDPIKKYITEPTRVAQQLVGGPPNSKVWGPAARRIRYPLQRAVWTEVGWIVWLEIDVGA